jgi:amino acid transporter
MKKKIFSENTFTALCILFTVIYLLVNFTSLSKATLFLACLFLIYFSSFFFNSFFKKVIIDKDSIAKVTRHYWLSIIAILIAAGVIYFLGNAKLVIAISFGVLIYAIFFMIYYLIKRSAGRGSQ